MEMDWAVWGPPLAVLAVSVVFGVWTSARMVAREADLAIGRETRRIDLESTHEEVLDALKQLDLDRDKLDPATWNREREELLARGSGALRALDHAPDGPSAVAAAAPAKAEPAAVAPIATAKAGAPPTIAPEWKGALYTLAAVAIGFVLYNYATSEAVDRRDGASMTGNQSLGGSAPMAPAGDPAAEFRDSPMFKDKEKALTEQIAANPQDVEAMNDLTLLYVNAGDPQKAFAQNEAALKAAPKDSDARTLRAVLTAMMGMEERALELLAGVLADDPTHAMALMFRARLYVVTGKPDEAVKGLEAAVKANPENPDLARFLEETRREVAQMGSQMAPPGASGPADVLVAGTLQLDPALASKLTGQETLFLSVADPARPRPPVAADKRMGPLSFPLPFQLTTANIVGMPGAGGVSPTLDFKARLDRDGNAMTTEADLPRVTVSGVRKGTSGMTITLSLSDAPVPAASAGGAVQESSLLAPAAPPPPAGAPPAAAGGDVIVAGRATVDPSRAAAISGAAIVFVSVLDPNGGPPLAATRVPAKFPLDFRLTTANVLPMMGNRPLPDTVLLSIRVDEDGNASTKAGEPEARVPNVRKGSSDLTVTLK